MRHSIYLCFNSSNTMKKLILILLFILPAYGYAQVDRDTIPNEYLDSIFIHEVEVKMGDKPKVLHAEPLYIDLIRDLGARAGEKEWNVGMGMRGGQNFNEYEALIEYEWAPIDRLGFEVELPFTLYGQFDPGEHYNRPSNRLESLKLATQWTFLVSEKHSTSLALGYIHEFELTDLNRMGQENLLRGNIYNPFFIAAKRWGMNYHTLIYTGPRLIREFGHPMETVYEINSNFHYMITGTRNFIGIEVNKEIIDRRLQTVIRPQMRVAIAENLMIGIVSGIPINQEIRGLQSFVRVIYEPGFRTMH
jgi:hypothetical protein